MSAYYPFATKFAHDIFKLRYAKDGTETWYEACGRVVKAVIPEQYRDHRDRVMLRMLDRQFIPGGRYLYAAGREFHQVNNCFLFRAEDSREGWSDLLHKCSMALMTGGGIGVDYSAVRGEGSPILRTGGTATGPLALMQQINEVARYVRQGGTRRSAVWAGLSWDHPDVMKFLALKNHSEFLKKCKAENFDFALPMELTNISVIYDKNFFDAYAAGDAHAQSVWLTNCRQAFETAEPGMAFNYANSRESLRNACTEVVSEDDSDKCNLGTLWLNRFDDIGDFGDAVEDAVFFLLNGGIYSDVPTERIKLVGAVNNRIGLGLGGIHEWLIKRGYKYEAVPELHEWLAAYRDRSAAAAERYAAQLKVNFPLGIRAIAPTGTIGILAESTTGIEPLFCKAYKRRYLDVQWKYQYVIDEVAARAVASGIPGDAIQDTYEIGFEDRVRFQADVQDYVDMSISSTCNMEPWGSTSNNESTVAQNAATLLKYAPRLRGFTVYPDGCRGGQPLSRVNLEEALHNVGQVLLESRNVCDITKGGTCGD